VLDIQRSGSIVALSMSFETEVEEEQEEGSIREGIEELRAHSIVVEAYT